VEWLLADGPSTVIDLGAGTGALSHLLVDRVASVIAVEPDDRMRGVLEQNLPTVTTVAGRGESMPLPDDSVDSVLASSSWHWVDVVPGLREVARVLVPGGTFGAVWTGPDPQGPFLAQAQALLAAGTSRDTDGGSLATGSSDIAEMVLDGQRFDSVLAIPDGEPFGAPVQHVHRWDIALNADELIGLLGTFSWIILMPEERRAAVLAEARRLLRDGLGVEGETTVDVAYRSEAWRTGLID
jgi:SAM-dependent methyltransferase